MTATASLTAERFAADAGGRVVHGPATRPIDRIAIDTRQARPGDTFIALRGEHVDGHAHLADALAHGVVALIVSDERALRGLNLHDATVVVVPETLAALQDAARAVRRRSGARVVAITGSAGKTTTKELTAAILRTRYATLHSRGNFNNHIGLPLSLLELHAGAEIAVVEMGMNHAGEIRQLVGIAEPDVRVWLNVGTAHIEHFGSRDAIADAKAEILDGAAAGTVFVANADDPRVRARVEAFAGRTITFGTGPDADVRPASVEDRGIEGLAARVLTPRGDTDIAIGLAGRTNLSNALAAIAAGVALDVPIDGMSAALAGVRPAPHRGEVLRVGDDVIVYDDSYNANPSALEMALDVIAGDRRPRRRVAFLGEMLELGAAAIDLHRAVAPAVVRAGVERLVTVGGDAARALGDAAVGEGLPAGNVTHVPTSDRAADLVPDVVRAGDLVFVKGSRGTRMERVVDRLRGAGA